MIKIVFLVSNLKKCGPNNQLIYILRNLDRTKFNPILISISNRVDIFIKQQIESLNIKFISLNINSFFTWDQLPLLRKIINSIRPQLIHSCSLRADFSAFFLKNKNLPIITTSRNYPLDDYPSKFPSVFGIIFAYLHIFILKRLNVISCSKFIQKKLKSHNINSLVIKNGIKFHDQVNLSIKDKNKLRKDLHLPPKAEIIVVVGELIKRKNVDLIIKAFNIISNENYYLLIIGDGPLKSNLEKIASNNVIFLGQIDNVLPYLKCSDLFISASFSEGLPNSVLEALASNINCLLSDIPPHIELLGENKINLFDPLNKHMLAKSILFAIKNKNILHKPKLENLKRYFGDDVMSRNYQNFYLKFLYS